MNGSAFSRPFLMAGVLLLAMLACLPGPAPTAAPPTVPPPQDTEAPAATEAPTEPVAQQYFTEEFDVEAGTWSPFVVDTSIWQTSPKSLPAYIDHNVDNMSVTIQDGSMVFDLQARNLWAYQLYDAYDYEDVRIDVVATNRGTSDNAISLICRYSKEEGWYEVNIGSNGLYNILHGTITKDNKVTYGRVANGGSNKIRQGKETNNYGLVCKGRTLIVFINGYETRRLDDNQYVLQKGKVGISVSSFSTVPVKVQMESVQISEP